MSDHGDKFLHSKEFSLISGAAMCGLSVVGILANGIALSFFIRYGYILLSVAFRRAIWNSWPDPTFDNSVICSLHRLGREMRCHRHSSKNLSISAIVKIRKDKVFAILTQWTCQPYDYDASGNRLEIFRMRQETSLCGKSSQHGYCL